MKTEPNAPTDWAVIFDELKEKESIASDAQLAATLGVTRGYVCSVRKGRKRISLELAEKIFSRLGRTFEMGGLEQLFVPEKVRRHTTNLRPVRDEVISRANGHCQLCGMPAPFKSPDGQPYLEVHHMLTFQEKGSNSPENMVALCPNCHRKMLINAAEDDRKKLQRIVAKYRKHK